MAGQGPFPIFMNQNDLRGKEGGRGGRGREGRGGEGTHHNGPAASVWVHAPLHIHNVIMTL